MSPHTAQNALTIIIITIISGKSTRRRESERKYERRRKKMIGKDDNIGLYIYIYIFDRLRFINTVFFSETLSLQLQPYRVWYEKKKVKRYRFNNSLTLKHTQRTTTNKMLHNIQDQTNCYRLYTLRQGLPLWRSIFYWQIFLITVCQLITHTFFFLFKTSGLAKRENHTIFFLFLSFKKKNKIGRNDW